MLYEFKSRATGTITMTDKVGRKVLEIIGKSPDPQGVITVSQIPGAIKALQEAAARDKAAQEAARSGVANEADPAEDGEGEGDESKKNHIGISQRVVPLIDMLQEAYKAGKDVTWGV